MVQTAFFGQTTTPDNSGLIGLARLSGKRLLIGLFLALNTYPRRSAPKFTFTPSTTPIALAMSTGSG